MLELQQRVAALLLAILDREDELPPEIVEAARDLEPDIADAVARLRREAAE